MSYETLHTAYPYNADHPSHDPKVNAAIEAHKEQYGGYNDAPPGWREIDEAAFVKGHFFTYNPEKLEYRQLRQGDRPMLSVRLYFFHDGTGVGMSGDGGELRFFAFGCQHKYRELSVKEAREHGFQMHAFDHAYTCEKCGHTHVVDSSG